MAGVTTGTKWKCNSPIRSPVATCSCTQDNITTLTAGCSCAVDNTCPRPRVEPCLPSTPVIGRNWKQSHGLPFSEDERLREDSCNKTCCSGGLKAGTSGFRDPSRRVAPSRIARNPCLRRVTQDTCTGPSCNARAEFINETLVTCPLGTPENRPATCPSRQPRSPVRRVPIFRRPIPGKFSDAPEQERPWTGTRPTKQVAKEVSSVKRPIKTSVRPSMVGSVTGKHASPSRTKRTGIPVRSSVGDQRPTSPLLSAKISQRPKPDVGDGLGRSRLSQSPVRKRQPLKPVPKPVVSQRAKPSETKRRVVPLVKGAKAGAPPKGRRVSFENPGLPDSQESDTNDEVLLMEVLLEPNPVTFRDVSPETPLGPGVVGKKIKDIGYDMRYHPPAVDDAKGVEDHDKDKTTTPDISLEPSLKTSDIPDNTEDVGHDVQYDPGDVRDGEDVGDQEKDKTPESSVFRDVTPELEMDGVPVKISDIGYDMRYHPPGVKDGVYYDPGDVRRGEDLEDHEKEKMDEGEPEHEGTDIPKYVNESGDVEKEFSARELLKTLLDEAVKDICCIGEGGEGPLELCTPVQASEDPCLRLLAVDSCDDTCVSGEPHQGTRGSLNAQRSRQQSKFPIPVDTGGDFSRPITEEEICGIICENIESAVSCDVRETIPLLDPCAEVCDSSSGEPCGGGNVTPCPPPVDFACSPVPECTVATCTSIQPIIPIPEISNLHSEYSAKAKAYPSQIRTEYSHQRPPMESPERIKSRSPADSSKVNITEKSETKRGSSVIKRTDIKIKSSKDLCRGDTTGSTKPLRYISPNARNVPPDSSESRTHCESLGRPQSPDRRQASRPESPRSCDARRSGSPRRSESKGPPERESRRKSPEGYKSQERHGSPEGVKTPETFESPERYESPKRKVSVRTSRRSDSSKRSASPEVPKRSETSKDEKEQRVYEPETPQPSPDETCNYCVKCEAVEMELKTENLEKYSLQTEEVEEFLAEVAMGGDSLLPEKARAQSYPYVCSAYNEQVSTPDLELLWKAPSEYLDVSVNVSVSGHVVGKEGLGNVPELSVDTEAMDIVQEGALEPIIRSMGETATPSENMRVTDESLRRIMGSPTSIAITGKESYKTAQDDSAPPAESIRGILAEKARGSHKKLSFAPLPKRSPLTNETSEEVGNVIGLMLETTERQHTKLSVQHGQKTSNVQAERHDRSASRNRERLASTDVCNTDTKLSVKSNVRISENTVCHEIKINFETPCLSPHPAPQVTDNLHTDDDRCTRKNVFLTHHTPPHGQGSAVRKSVAPISSSPVSLVREGNAILTSLPEITYAIMDEDHETPHGSKTDFDADKVSAGERFAGPPLPDGDVQSPRFSPQPKSSEVDSDGRAINVNTKVPPDSGDSVVDDGENPPDTSKDFIQDMLNFDLTTRATAKEEELTSQSLANITEVEVSRDSMPISDTSVGKVTVVEIEEANIPDGSARDETLTSAGDGSVSSVEFDPAFLQRLEHDVESRPVHSIEGYRKAHTAGDGRDTFETLSSIPPDVVPPIREMRRTEIPSEVRDVLRKLNSMQSEVVPAIQAVREKSIPVEVKDILERLSTLEKNVDEFLSKGLNGITEELTCSDADCTLPEKLTPETVKCANGPCVPQDSGDVSETTKSLPSDSAESTEFAPCLCFPDEERRRDRKRKRPCVCPPSYQKRDGDSPEAAGTETEKKNSDILFELRVFSPPKGFEDTKEEAKPIASTTVKRRGLVATKITKSGGDDRKGGRKAVCVCGRDSAGTKSTGARAQTPVSKSGRVLPKKDIASPQETGDVKVKKKETPTRPPGVTKIKVPIRKIRLPCICKVDSPNNAAVVPMVDEGKPCPDVERTTLFMIRRRELIPIASLPPEIDFPKKSMREKDADSPTSTELSDETGSVSQESGRNVDNEFSVRNETLKTAEFHKFKTSSRSGDKAAVILSGFANEGETSEENVSKGSEELPWEDALDTFSANLDSLTNDKLREEIRKFVTSRFEDVNACRHLPEEITLGIHYYSDDSEDAVKKNTRESASQVLSQIMEVEREAESDSQVPSETESAASRKTYLHLIRESEPSETTERTSGDSAESNVSNEIKALALEDEKRKHRRSEVKPTLDSRKIRLKDLRPREGSNVVRAVDRVPGVEVVDRKESTRRVISPARTSDKETIPSQVKATRVSEARLRSPSSRNVLRRTPPKKVESQAKSTCLTENKSVHESRNKGKVSSHLSPSRPAQQRPLSSDGKRKEKVIHDPHGKLSLSFSNEDVKKRMSLRSDVKLKEPSQKSSLLSEECVWEDAVESLSKSEMASKTSREAEVFGPLRPIVVSKDIVEFVTRFTTDQVRQGLSISKIFSRLREKMEHRKTADVAVFASRQSLVTKVQNDAQTQTEPMVSKTVKILVEKSSEVSVRVREVSVDKLGRRKQSKELTASMARGREIAYSASNARVTHVEERRVSSQKLIVGEHGVSSRNSTREDVVIRMVPARGAQKDTIEIWRDDRLGDPMGMEVEVSHVTYDPHVIRGGVPEEEKEQQIAWEGALKAGEAAFKVESTFQHRTVCEEQQISLDRSVTDSFSQTPIGDGPFLDSGDGLLPRNNPIAASLENHQSNEKTGREDKVEHTTVQSTLEMGDNQCIELEQSNIQQQTICLQQQKIQITSSVIQQQKIHTSRSPLRTKRKDSGECHPGSRKYFKDPVSADKLINLPPDICGCPLQTDGNKPVFEDLPIVILHENTGSERLPFNRSVPEDMAFQADDSLKHVQATTELRKSSNTLHDHIKQKRKFSSWDAMLEEAERRLSETEEKRRTGEISHEQAAKEFSNVARALRRSARKGMRNREDTSKKKLGEAQERIAKRGLSEDGKRNL